MARACDICSKGVQRGNKISLENAIKRQCRDTARLYGLDDRGVLAPGYLADINVIDLDAVKLGKPWLAFDLPAGGKRLQHGARPAVGRKGEFSDFVGDTGLLEFFLGQPVDARGDEHTKPHSDDGDGVGVEGIGLAVVPGVEQPHSGGELGRDVDHVFAGPEQPLYFRGADGSLLFRDRLQAQEVFRGKANDVAEVAKRLGVQHVIAGSVRKIGNRIRITARLVDGATGAQVWAESRDSALPAPSRKFTVTISSCPAWAARSSVVTVLASASVTCMWARGMPRSSDTSRSTVRLSSSTLIRFFMTRLLVSGFPERDG